MLQRRWTQQRWCWFWARVCAWLQELFPATDVGSMLGRAPSLLLQSSTALRSSARELRDVMQTEQVDE